MPIYLYACSACGKRTEILHGINESAPSFCPECGAEGTLRKGFVAPAVVFKGSGWAKKDRRTTPTAGRSRDDADGASESKSGESKSGESKSGESKSAEAKSGESGERKSADSGSSASSSTSSSTDKPAAKASEGA